MKNKITDLAVETGLIKLDAVIGRGRRKDFYDVYFINRLIPLEELLAAGEKKFKMMRDFQLMALEGLVQFDYADRDHQPDLLEALPWEIVRTYFIEQVKIIGNKWFNMYF
ncbi:MAG: hypothetical protein WCP19_12245 [Chloroflexota bacterium]